MARFEPPFAHGATRRPPTASETLNGFPCGPADKQLFDFLHWAYQSELGHLIAYAGLTPSNSDMQQVRKAIEALISSATGEGDTSQFVLFNQARSRLLFFPEVLSSDGRINVTTPTGGQVRVPAGVTVLHRGIWPVSTSDFDEGQRTFTTSANRTYHLRLNLAPGAEQLTLEDLADTGAYNPGALPETDPSFDSAYDDMLVARVVTNGANAATITSLANRHRLQLFVNRETAAQFTFPNSTPLVVTPNWARSPRLAMSQYWAEHIVSGAEGMYSFHVATSGDIVSPEMQKTEGAFRRLPRYGFNIHAYSIAYDAGTMGDVRFSAELWA